MLITPPLERVVIDGITKPSKRNCDPLLERLSGEPDKQSDDTARPLKTDESSERLDCTYTRSSSHVPVVGSPH
jgi:hypothetical protein